MEPIVVFLLVLSIAAAAVGVVWAALRRGRAREMRIEGPPRQPAAPSPRDAVGSSLMEVVEEPGSLRPLLLDDGYGRQMLIEPVAVAPATATPVPAAVASHLAAEVGRLVPMLQLAGEARGDQLLRLVKAPPGELARVAGKSELYRGFGLQDGEITGHAELAKVTTSGVLTPQLALSVATAALGMYWQQQIDSKLKEIEGAVKDVQKHLNLVLDASVERAEETLREHEASPPPGRYEPPAIVTDGLTAVRVHRKKLELELKDLRALKKSDLSHSGYMRRVLKHESEEPLAELLFKAIRGLALEVRVLRLKQRTSLGEPEAYRRVLEEHNARLDSELQLIRDVVLTARGIQSSNNNDGLRAELPNQRRQRQKSQKGRANRLRGQLKELTGLIETLEPFVVLPDVDDEPIELYLTVGADGSATAVAGLVAALSASSE